MQTAEHVVRGVADSVAETLLHGWSLDISTLKWFCARMIACYSLWVGVCRIDCQGTGDEQAKQKSKGSGLV